MCDKANEHAEIEARIALEASHEDLDPYDARGDEI